MAFGGATEIAKLYATIGMDASDFSRAMAGVDKDLSGFQKGMAGLQSAVGTGLKVAAGVAVTAVASLGAGIVKATSAAADMEQAIADTGAAMNLSADETAQLKSLITDLGLDPNLKVSATEAAQAIDSLGRNGLNVTQILDGAAKSTVLLANATGAEFGTAADIATDVMQQFNITAKDMDKAVSAISGVTIASKFTIDDYRLAIAQAGGVASSVGVSFDDFNAVIAATSPLFASGSDAGTSFKTFLQRLAPTTNTAKDAMKELGLITADGTNKFFDASGAMKGMDEIAAILDNAFGGLSEEQKNNAASTIFGTDAMRTLFGIMNAGQDGILEYKKNIGNTSAEELAARRMDTLKGAFEIFGGIVETISLGVGDKFLPVVRKIVEWASNLASDYGPKVIDWFGKLANWLSTATDMVIALLSGGDRFSEWLTTVPEPVADVVKGVMAFYEGAKALFKGIGDVIGQFVKWQDVLVAVAAVAASVIIPAIGALIAAAWPIVATFAAIVAAVAALRIAWQNDFLGIKTFTLEAFKYLKENFGGLFTAIQQFGKGALKEIHDWLTGNDTDFKNLNAIWTKAKETFAKVFTDMGNALRTFGDFLWTEFRDRFPAAANVLEGAVNGLKWVWDQAWSAIKGIVKSGLEGIAGWLQQYTGMWKGDWQSTMDHLVSGQGITALRILFTQNIPGWIKGMVLEGIHWVGRMKQNLIDRWYDIKTDASAKWGDIVNEVTYKWNYWLNEGKRILIELHAQYVSGTNRIKNAIQIAWNEIVDWTTKKWDEWFSWFKPSEWWQMGKDLLQGLWDGLKSIWDNGSGGGIWGWSKARWQELKDGFSIAFEEHSPSRWFMRGGQNIMEGLQLGLSSGVGGVNATFDSFSEGLKDRARALNLSLEGSITDIGRRIISLQNYKESIANIGDTINQQLAGYNFPTTVTGSLTQYTPHESTPLDPVTAYFGRSTDYSDNYLPGHGVYSTIGSMVNFISGYADDFLSSVMSFANTLDYGTLRAARIGSQSDQSYIGAAQALGNPAQNESRLVDAIYSLIEHLRNAPTATTQFHLGSAPQRTGNAADDMASVVQYLSVLYSS